jgi:hypothetical protein
MRALVTVSLLAALAPLGCSTKPGGDPPPPSPSAVALAPASAPAATPAPPTSGIVEMVTRTFLRRRSADGAWHDETLAPPNPHGEIFRGMLTTGADVHAMGYAYTGVDGPDDGIVYKRDASGRWQRVFKVERKELGGGWASGPDDVYAAGVAVAHFDGKSWREIQIAKGSRASYRISGSGPKDVWAFSSEGTVFHFEGEGEWTPQADLKTAIQDGLVIDAKTAYAVGDGGAVFHRTGAAWKKEDSGLKGQLTQLWASGPSDVYAAGSALIHSTGDGKWSKVEVPGIGQPTQIAGRSSKDIWALGLSGIAHYDGSRWEPISLDVVQPAGTRGMVALDALSVTAGEVFVAGDVTTAK